MKNISELSIEELAVYVSHYLRKNGIAAVLTGGACVSIYTDNKYQSYDLDFVNIEEISISRITSILKEIGFEAKDRIFVNENVKYSIDILSPPLSVGEQKIVEVNRIEIDGMVLELLTPTDSTKDRLAAFYFWNDRQALEQAIMIQNHNEVDFDAIKIWSEMEGEMEKFNYFLKKIKRKQKV